MAVAVAVAAAPAALAAAASAALALACCAASRFERMAAAAREAVGLPSTALMYAPASTSF